MINFVLLAVFGLLNLKPAMQNLLNAVETQIPPGQTAPPYMLNLQEKYREALKKLLKE